MGPGQADVAEKCYHENFPWQITALCAGLTFSSYALGTVIFYLFYGLVAWGYLALCAVSLLISLRLRCTFCYYYGRRCASGLGTLSKLLFKKGDPDEFGRAKNVVPVAVLSFTVMLLPMGAAIAATALNFSWLVPVLFFLYIIVAIVPGFILRNSVFCKSCNQRELGCPACQAMHGEKMPG